MDQALRLASSMAQADNNLGTLARALLETRLHLQPLEQVMVSAESCMRSGQDAARHWLILVGLTPLSGYAPVTHLHTRRDALVQAPSYKSARLRCAAPAGCQWWSLKRYLPA